MNYFDPRHPHEEIPPSLDAEGRCLVCGLLVERDELEQTVRRLRTGTEATPSVDAVAYGRRVLLAEVATLKRFEQEARAEGKHTNAKLSGDLYRWIEWKLLGGEGCVVTAFDDRWLDDAFRRSASGTQVSPQ